MLFLLPLLLGFPVLAAEQSTQDSTVSALISDLSADDSIARNAAAEKLVAMGAIGRPAVLEASHSDDPEIRAGACQVLLKLPWTSPSDPPQVQAILSHYTDYRDDIAGADQPPAAPPGVENRKAAAAALANLDNFAGCDALIRLVYEDPDNSVRWAIVHALRTSADPSRLAGLRRADAPADDPPLAALYGLAWVTSDPPKATPLLRQAIEGEFTQPSDDGGELDFVVGLLVDLEEDAGRYDSGADLLRRELAHDPPTDRHNAPLPLLRLFALHADHGPLRDFETDRKLAANFMDDPKLGYAMARIDLRRHNDDQAATERRAAFKAGGDSRLDRFDVGKFLSDRGWDEEAEAEFKAFLAMPPGADEGDSNEFDANAHFQLATLAARRDDDLEVAEQKKTAMSILGGGTTDLVQSDGLMRQWSVTENQVWAEIHWRYLRVAVAHHDQAAIAEHLKEVVRLRPNDEDIAIDVVPILKERGEPEQAKQIFDSAYKEARARLDADPSNAGLMNGLAWLDAKCDENLAEAERLAKAAVAAVPDDPAVIDTLAEVNFHLGRFAQAVQLEEGALKLQPGDKFMTGQLARFKAGK